MQNIIKTKKIKTSNGGSRDKKRYRTHSKKDKRTLLSEKYYQTW